MDDDEPTKRPDRMWLIFPVLAALIMIGVIGWGIYAMLLFGGAKLPPPR